MNQAPGRSGFAPRRFYALGLVVFIGFALYFLVYRDFYDTPPDRARGALSNNWLQKGFSVAVAWPPHTDTSLVEGVTLALEDLNASQSPLAGKITLRLYSEIADKGAVARDIAKNRDVLAVIGHEVDGTSIPASITYERNGIVFISPKITDQRLTDHRFRFVFRLTPDDPVVAKALAQFAVDHDWKRIGVLYGRTLRHQLIANQFITAARRDGVVLPFERSFFHDPESEYRQQDFRSMLSEIRREQFDAIMLADDLPWAGKLLIDMKQMGITQPIIATDRLDSMTVWRIAGVAANNLFVASAVNPSSTNPNYLDFQTRFRKRFGAEPGYGASQGYEAFTLFVKAVLKAGSADPIVVATTMKTNTWQGLFGDFTFDDTGDIVGRDVSIKRMQDGAFRQVVVQKEY